MPVISDTTYFILPASSCAMDYPYRSLMEILKTGGGNPVTTTGLPLPKADPLVTRSMDEFIDSIQGESIRSRNKR